MFKYETKKQSKQYFKLKKVKDPIDKVAKKQEKINADPTGGTGWRVKPEYIFENFKKKKKGGGLC